MHYDSCLVVDSIGKSGDLDLLWMNGAKVRIDYMSSHHINAVIDEMSESTWHFIGFYRVAATELRWRSWDLLRILKARHNLPWLCMGEFNEITSVNEKMGGAIRPKAQMAGFQDAILDCGFLKVPYSGSVFT